MVVVIWSAKYWLLFIVPLSGYGFAWFGHAFVEKNRPLSLRAPIRSLFCDYRLAAIMWAGQGNTATKPRQNGIDP